MVRVLFIGSGAVNFGGAEGPWDHSRRLEALDDVQVVAIADPDLSRAASVLERKLNGSRAAMYADCKLYASYLDALEASNPDVAFIGKKRTNCACARTFDLVPSFILHRRSSLLPRCFGISSGHRTSMP